MKDKYRDYRRMMEQLHGPGWETPDSLDRYLRLKFYPTWWRHKCCRCHGKGKYITHSFGGWIDSNGATGHITSFWALCEKCNGRGYLTLLQRVVVWWCGIPWKEMMG